MDLQDLKTTWRTYDQQLNQNLRFNETVLRRLHLDRSKKEMNTPLSYEAISSTILFVSIVLMVTCIYNFGQDFYLLLSGLGTLLLLGLWLALSFWKIYRITQINYFNNSIVAVQKDLLSMKKAYMISRRIEIGTGPLLFVVAFPILVKALRNLDFLENPKMFLTFVIIGSVVSLFSFVTGYWFYYDRKLKNASRYLSEIAEFEAEEDRPLDLV